MPIDAKLGAKLTTSAEVFGKLAKVFDLSWLSSRSSMIQKPYGVEKAFGWKRLLNIALVAVLFGFCFVYGFVYALVSPFLILQFTVPVVVLAAIVIWALPDLDRAPTHTLGILYFAYLVALTCWPNYLAIALPSLPWITMIRLFGVPMAMIFLICISSSPQVRADTAETLRFAPPMWKMMVGFVVTQFAAIPFADVLQRSIQMAVITQINWTAIFFISCYLFRTLSRAQQWAYIVWGALLFVCLIGVYEGYLGAVPWAGHVPSFLKIEDESVQRILAGAVRGSTGSYRVQSVFTTPLGLGEFVALSLPFVLHFLGAGHPIPVRAAAFATIPLAIFVVLASDSRLGLIGAIIAVLMTVFLWATLWWRRHKSSLIGPAVVLAYPAFFCFAIAATFLVGRIRERIWGSGQYDDSNQARITQMQTGLPMIATHPLGHGPGMGAEALGFANPAGVLTIDTYYLLIGLDYGIMGFIFYYGMFGLAAYLALRAIFEAQKTDGDTALLAPLSVSLFNFLIIKSIFSNDENHPLAFMMLGMTMALAWRVRQANEAAAQGESPRMSPTPPARRPLLARWAGR